MPRTVEAGFLEAICANPDDDTDHLVYADWLDDHGDPAKAEFIRTQCALAHLRPDDPQWAGLRIREQLLIRDHRKEWVDRLPKWMRPLFDGFRRGFPSKVRCRPAEYRRATTFNTRYPVEEMFSWSAPDLESPHLPRLRAFVNNSGKSTELVPLLERMTNLRELTLHYPCRSETAASQRFAEMLTLPVFDRLHRLHMNLSNHTHEPPVCREMQRQLGQANLASLRSLCLYADDPQPDDLATILAAPFVANLQELFLVAPLTEPLARTLAAQRLPNLKYLALGHSSAQAPVLASVLAASFAQQLRGLLLNGVTDATLRELENGPPLAELRWLLFQSRHHSVLPSAATWERLLRSGRLLNLVHLDFDVSSAETALSLTTGPYTPKLRGFTVPGGTTLAQAEQLVRSPHLPQLQALSGVAGSSPPCRLGNTHVTLVPTVRWID